MAAETSEERYGRFRVTAEQRRRWRAIVATLYAVALVLLAVAVTGVLTGHKVVTVIAFPLAAASAAFATWCAWAVESHSTNR